MPAEEDTTLDTVPRIDLRIPGPWQSAQELADALAAHCPEYSFDIEKALLAHAPSGQSFLMSGSAPDDQIAELFESSGRMSEEETEALRRHTVKVHVSGPGGSVEAARAVMDAGTAVMEAGGLGVMVDNSGATHGPTDWFKLAGDTDPGGLYWAFVVVTGSEDEVWSAGMHCLGYRDASMPPTGDRVADGYFLHNFLGYAYQSGQTILDGDPLGDPENVLYYARHQPCTRFPSDSPWFNPYGIWRLEPAGEETNTED